MNRTPGRSAHSYQTAAIRTFAMLSGTMNFQAKFISRSTRIRGSVTRIQNIRKTNPITFARKTDIRMPLTRKYDSQRVPMMFAGKSLNGGNGTTEPPPRKSTVPRQLTPKTLMYSARKKRPNRIPEYSVWYPAMISDSASGRSNGVRFTSAMLATRKIANASRPGGESTNQPVSSCLSKIVTRLRLPAQSTTGIVERICGIS